MRASIKTIPTFRQPWRGGRHLSTAALAAALLVPAMAAAQVVVPSGGTLGVPAGSSMNLACTGLVVNGSFALGSGQVDDAAGVTINPGGTVNGGQGTVNVSGNWVNSGSFVPGTSTVAFNEACSPSGSITITGVTTFHNLVLDGADRTFVVPAGSNILVTGLLRLEGDPGHPVQIVSSDPGQTATIRLGPGAQVLRSDVNVAANVLIIPAATPTSIPTLEPVALVVLSALLGAGGWLSQRRRIRKAAPSASTSA